LCIYSSKPAHESAESTDSRHTTRGDPHRDLWRGEHSALSDQRPRYSQNKLRQDLWRAGHAHAGVLLILSLVGLLYLEHAKLSPLTEKYVRFAVPCAAILLPLAFFFSVLKPDATVPNAMIYLAHVGAVELAVALVIIGVGLIRGAREGPAMGRDPIGVFIDKTSDECSRSRFN
jgi:hypothetical protein